MENDLKIFHMSSFSRCGETLMLRCLSAHPDIHIVHNLVTPPEPEEDMKLFHLLRNYKEKTIPRDHPRIVAAGASDKKVLVIKNAVWEHQHPYEGFILVRNPLSIVQSFKLVGESKEKFHKRKEQYKRWFDGVDPRLNDCINLKNNIILLCAFYNRKMFPLTKLDLPVIRYEDFVEDHTTELKRIIAHLGLDWTDEVLKSHEKYNEGEYGHGHLPLWRDIHKGSTDKYKDLPEHVLSLVYGLTYSTLTSFGYEFDEDYNITIKS